MHDSMGYIQARDGYRQQVTLHIEGGIRPIIKITKAQEYTLSCVQFERDTQLSTKGAAVFRDNGDSCARNVKTKLAHSEGRHLTVPR